MKVTKEIVMLKRPGFHIFFYFCSKKNYSQKIILGQGEWRCAESCYELNIFCLGGEYYKGKGPLYQCSIVLIWTSFRSLTCKAVDNLFPPHLAENLFSLVQSQHHWYFQYSQPKFVTQWAIYVYKNPIMIWIQ